MEVYISTYNSTDVILVKQISVTQYDDNDFGLIHKKRRRENKNK